ncbi:cell growth-regulating nucleolar protein-like isoform X2 [Ptychodera flava]
MVFFNCNACGQTVKKNQVEKHYQTKCPQCEVLSCLDCGKEFYGDEYNSHIRCITEDEKYGNMEEKASAGKLSKGEVKQANWLEKVKQASEAEKLSPRMAGLVKQVTGYINIPRKQAKFKNFLHNSIRVTDQKTCEELWKIFDSANREAKSEPKAAETAVNEQKPEVSKSEEPAKQKSQQGKENKEEKEVKVKNKDKDGDHDDKEDETVQKVDKEKKAKKSKEGEKLVENGETKKEKKKKKSKKKHQIDETVTVSQALNSNSELTQSDYSKKKKKKKVREDLPNIDEQAVENGERQKERKEKKKEKNKVNGVNQTIEKDVDAAGSEKTKKKKKKRRVMQEDIQISEDEPVENGESKKEGKKKKTKKKRKIDDTESGDQALSNITESEISTKKKRKKDKKRENITKDGDQTNDGNLKPGKRKFNETEGTVTETQAEDSEKGEMDTTHDSDDPPRKKFRWESTIKSVLETAEDNAMSIKKLRKKVLSEFWSQGGDHKLKREEDVLATFNRKIQKNKKFKVHKEKVKLAES